MSKGKGGGPVFTEDALIDGIPGSRGIYGDIARRVGCGRSVIDVGMKKYPRFRKAVLAEREEFIDEMEGELVKKVEKGDLTSIIFGLKCLGKKRGYVEREKIGIEGDMSFTFRWEGEGKKGGNVNNGPV